MKPRIFIGSSREGRSFAQIISDKLSDISVCNIWDENFFGTNRSSLESLNENSSLFDFAFLVATNDDVQLKRDALESIARDNVIFEFGLYVGRLGRNRAFLFKEKGTSLPSDLFGITVQEFKTSLQDSGKTLEQVCEDVKSAINDLSTTYELSFVPSTVLAVGYYENFLLPVSRELMQSEKRSINDKNFLDFKIHVIIPDELPDNFNDQVIAYLGDKKLENMSVQTSTRKFNFYLDYSQNQDEVLELYDLPTTLSALKKSIEMAIPPTYVGETRRERIFKQKEMNNFCETLTYLINKNAITRQKTKVEFIDVKS